MNIVLGVHCLKKSLNFCVLFEKKFELCFGGVLVWGCIV